MFFRFFFTRLSLKKQVQTLKKRGTFLGTREKDSRKVYIYMLTNLFVEVIYKNDDVENEPEQTRVLAGLKRLNAYLETEFKSSFNSI
ncbi:MAG TPA: hypothetical protein VIL31_06240 [Cyclobacteriaceae bacterium]|jgi:hypothetical protein